MGLRSLPLRMPCGMIARQSKAARWRRHVQKGEWDAGWLQADRHGARPGVTAAGGLALARRWRNDGI